MHRVFLRTFLALAVAGVVNSASAFSLLGPYATWEVQAISYNALNTDVGGPLNLGEGYRWNVKTVTYGFDKSFQDYFGQRGIDEINKATAIMNALPPVSKMSASLSEFPQDSRQVNFQATSLALLDMKSYAMGALMEEIGLADPERYVWTLRSRVVTPPPATNYFVIMRSFDPVTWNPSPYVNGVLYTYTIGEFGPNPQYADAVESTVDPLAIGFSSVAGAVDAVGIATQPSITAGIFFTGLTRDDVGGIRYLLNKKLLNVENPLPNTVAAFGGGGSPWQPVGGGGGGGGSNIVQTALRRGVDRIQFKYLKYYGAFPGFTNFYTDTYFTNGQFVSQRVGRVQTAPDIVFSCGDLGVDVSGQPVLLSRTATAGWANNSAINTPPSPGVEVDGPGVIQSPVVISFSNVGPFIANVFPGFLTEDANAGTFGGWGAFDGSTNAPFLFPNGQSIQQLQNFILSHGGL